MKPEAILTAAAELIEQIEKTITPASELINQYTRSRRYIGSKDRRMLTDLVWTYLRHRARLNYLFPQTDIKTKLKIPTDSLILPANTPDWVRYETPDWLIPLIENAATQLPALLEPAPIILRANGNRDTIQKQCLAEGLEVEPTQHSPLGLILKKRVNLNAKTVYQKGLIEVQDEASQLVGLETQIKPNMRVLDYCAGAGGKSLLFAQMMQNKGTIVAHDISSRSLQELEKRAKRAHARIIQTQTHLNAEQLFDHVVADAPCSGTGTWRRCPDMRWKLTQNQLNELIQKQADILDKAARFTAPNGFLSYMTCSLTIPENTAQADNFLKRHPDFKRLNQKQFSPAQTGTDGLFIATFQKITA